MSNSDQQRHCPSSDMVPGEDVFTLNGQQKTTTLVGATKVRGQSNGTLSSCRENDKSTPVEEDEVEEEEEEEDEEDDSESTDMVISPTSVHVVNPESPDDAAYVREVGGNPLMIDGLRADGQDTGDSTQPSDEQGPSSAGPSTGCQQEGGGGGRSRPLLPNGKKTKGRVKIKMEFIDNKLRRYTTFSKRKTGIMKKAFELSTLTGTQVMLLVASETGHVYTFATKKLRPVISSEAGKSLIQTCLNSSDEDAAAAAAACDLSVASEITSDSMSEMTPDGTVFTSSVASGHNQGLSTRCHSVPKAGGHRARGRLGTHGRNGRHQATTLKANSKAVFNAYGNDLPTMVAPVSMFSAGACESDLPAVLQQSSDEGDLAELDDSDTTPTSSRAMLNGSAGRSGQLTTTTKRLKLNSPSGNRTTAGQQQITTTNKAPVFSLPGVMPSGGQQQQPFSFVPSKLAIAAIGSANHFSIAGIAANGSFVYQVPSGLVYASPTATLPMTDMGNQAQFMFAGFPTAVSTATGGGADSGCGTSNLSMANGQQQFITIPVPIPITPQSLLHPGLMQTFHCAGNTENSAAGDHMAIEEASTESDD